jgi:hypothetical protein
LKHDDDSAVAPVLSPFFYFTRAVGTKGARETSKILASIEAKHVPINDLTFMAIWVVEFSRGDTKLERVLPKNQHTQRKLLNFENWCNGGGVKYFFDEYQFRSTFLLLTFFDNISF